MRILVLCHEYPPIGGGGGRVAQDICLGLAKRGHQVTVLTASYGNLPAKEIQGGVEILRLKSGRKFTFKAGLLAMAGFIWAAFWRSLGIIKQDRPDIIHAHFAVPTGAAAWALKQITGIPYVLTAHLGDVPGGVPEKTGRWFKWVYPLTPAIWRSAARVAAVSDFTRSLALNSYDVPVETIHNGVDTTTLDPGNIQVNRPPRIVFAGRFVHQKNPVVLVNILARLKDLPWNCTMIGDGLLLSNIQEAIQRGGLAERITLTGWIPPEDVIEVFSHCDILFMPSLSEGLPVVGVQALSMGLALVMSRVGGCVELVQEGVNGALCDPADETSFEKILRRYLADPGALFAARLASRELARKFEISGIVIKYESILADATSS